MTQLKQYTMQYPKKPNTYLTRISAKCFDRINHEALLEKLNTFPTLRRQIKAWLKSGVMDNKELFPTNEGTPQGGVISPLLANILLHGLESRIKQAFPHRKVNINSKRKHISCPDFIRYADDFVVLHEDLNTVQRCQQIINEWLKGTRKGTETE